MLFKLFIHLQKWQNVLKSEKTLKVYLKISKSHLTWIYMISHVQVHTSQELVELISSHSFLAFVVT